VRIAWLRGVQGNDADRSPERAIGLSCGITAISDRHV
jgi:hypothetical protein